MSWLRHLSMITFKKFNPSWSVRLYRQQSCVSNAPWRDAAVQDFSSYSGPDYTNNLKDAGIEVIDWSNEQTNQLDAVHQSDLFRWQLLSEQGGFYADTDILFLSPFLAYDKMKSVDLVTCFYDGYFSIGFLGSSPSNKFYADVATLAKHRLNTKSYESAGIPVIHEMLGVKLSAHKDAVLVFALRTKYPHLHIHHCRKSLVYPFSVQNVYGPIQQLPRDTIGIHWFAGYPHAQAFNNSITPEKMGDADSLLAHYIRSVL